jgi:hypothetical protein
MDNIFNIKIVRVLESEMRNANFVKICNYHVFEGY